MDSLNGTSYIGSLRMPLGVGIEHETVWSRWCKNAAERPNSEAIIHWAGGEAPFRWTFSCLLAAAERYASCLSERKCGAAMSAPLSCITIANSIRYTWRFARRVPFRQFWPIRIPASILISSGKASRACRAVPALTGSSLSGNWSLSWNPLSQVPTAQLGDYISRWNGRSAAKIANHSRNIRRN